MGPQEDYIETVLTCEGDFYDPDFHTKLQTFSQRLQALLLKGGGNQLILKKVEPWNSVRVTFNIPREAALRLRQLAEQGHATLRDLGILAVQIDGDRIISLTIAGKNNERTELVFQMPSAAPSHQPHGSLFDMNSADEMSLPGPSNVEATRKNIAQYLRDQGGHGPNLFESLFGQQPSAEFKSPHLVGPMRESGPGRPGPVGPFGSPSRSPSHCIPGTAASNLAPLGLPSPAHSHSQGLPSPGMGPGPASPGYPTPPPSQPPLPGSPGGRSCAFPAASTSPLNNMQRLLPNKDITSASPLLVNLLQTDPAAAHLNSLLHQKMPPPGEAAKRKRRPRKNKDTSPKGKPGMPESGNGLAAMFGLAGDCPSNGPHPGEQNPGDSSSLPAALQARLGLPGALDTGQLPGNRPTDSVLPGGMSPARSLHSSPEKIINPYTGQLEPVDNTSDRDSDLGVPRSESTESLNSLDVPAQLHPPPNPLVALQNRLAACDGNSGQLLNKSSPHLDIANSINTSRIPFSQPGRLSPGACQVPPISGVGRQSPCVSEADLPPDRVSPAALKARLSPGCSQPGNLPMSPARQAMSRVSADFMPRPGLPHGEGPAPMDSVVRPSFPSDHFMNARSHQVLSTIRGLPPGMRAAHPRLPPPYRYPSSSGGPQQHHVIPPHSAPATANLLSSGGPPPSSALPMAMGLRLGGPHRPQNSTSSRLPSLMDTLPHSTSIVESVAAKLTNVMSGMPERGQPVGARKGSWDGLDVKREPGCTTSTTAGPQPSSPLTNNGHTDSSSQKGSLQDTKPVNHNSTCVNDLDSSAQSKPDSVCKSEPHATHATHSTELNDKVPPAAESNKDKNVTIKTESIKSEDSADLCESKNKDKERTISRFDTAADTPASVAFKLELGAVPSPVVSSAALSAAAMHNDLHTGLVRGSNGASTGEASPMSSDNASSASQPLAEQSPLPNNLAHALNHDSESSHSDDNPSTRNASGLVPLGQAVLKDASHAVEAKDTEHKNVITVGYALSRDNNTAVTKDILGDKVLKSLGNLPYLTKPNKDKDYMPGVKGVPLAAELIGQGNKLVKSPIILKEVDTRTQEVQERCQEEEERARSHAYLNLTKCLSLPPHVLPQADSCPPLLERTLAINKEAALKSTVVIGPPSHSNHLTSGANPLWSGKPTLATSLRGPSGESREASPAPGEAVENHCNQASSPNCSVAPQTSLAAGPLLTTQQQTSKSLPVSPRARTVSPRCSQFSSTAPPSPSGDALSGRRSAPIPGFHPLQAVSPRARPVRSYTPALGLMEALSRAQVSAGGVPGWVSPPPRAALSSPRALLHPTDPNHTSQLSQDSNQSNVRGADPQPACVSEASRGPQIPSTGSVTSTITTTLPACGRPPYSQAAEKPPTAGSEGSVAKQPSPLLNTAQKSPGQAVFPSTSVPGPHEHSANTQPAGCLSSAAPHRAATQTLTTTLPSAANPAASTSHAARRLVPGLPIPKALGVWNDIPTNSSSGCSPTAQLRVKMVAAVGERHAVSTAACSPPAIATLSSSPSGLAESPTSAVVVSAGLRSPGVSRAPAMPRSVSLSSPPPVLPRAVSLSSPPSSSAVLSCSLPQLVPAPSAASLTAVQPTWSCTAAAPSTGSVRTAQQPCLLDNNIVVKAEVASGLGSVRPVTTVVSSAPPVTSGASGLLPASTGPDRSVVSSKGVSILQPMYERDADVEAELDMIAKLEGKATKETGHRGLDTTMMTLIPHKGSRSTFTVAQLLDDSKAKKNTPNTKHSRMFTVNTKDSNAVLPTTCVKTTKSASVKSSTSAGLRSQTISGRADFPRNSSAHLSSLMQKSIQSQPSLLNSAPHPITAPGFHLNLTESVQRVMSAIPCVDALSPPLDPPAVSLPGSSPHKEDNSVRSPAAGSKAALLPVPCLTPQASRTPSPKAVRTDSSGPASSPLTSPTGPSPQAERPAPSTLATCNSDEVVCATKESVAGQSSPSQQTEVVESRLGITRVKSEERVDSGIETSSTGTPSSSDTSSVASLHMPEHCVHEELPLETEPGHCNGPSHASPDHGSEPGQDHATPLSQEMLAKTDDNRSEDAPPRLARVTRRSSRSSTDSRSGSAESLRSKEETVQGGSGSRRRLRSDGSDISTETVDSGRGTRCSMSADRTSTPSPTPRSTRVSTRSVRKRTSPDVEESSSVEPAQAVTRGSKRKLVLEDESSEKRPRPEDTAKEGLRARKPTAPTEELEGALEEHNYSGSKRARLSKKDDENTAETPCKKIASKKSSEKQAKSPCTEKPVCVGRARPGKAAVEPRAAEDGTAKRATRSTRSRDPGDVPAAPVGKRRRSSRDHR